MQTLEGLRRQIDTATDLRSVVTTMKTLAAVSIHQYERAVSALADYNRTIEMGFRIALHQQPLGVEAPRPTGLTGAVVFGSNQGMCGQFNEEIVGSLRAAREAEPPGEPWLLLVVGTRAEGQLLDAGQAVDQVYPTPTSVTEITALVQELLPRVERWRSERDVTRLLVFHNRRTSASSYEPRRLQMLPLDRDQLHEWSRRPWESRSLPSFTMERRRLLSRVLRQYLFVSLFRACAESLASENASRIAAMQAAERNIEERLEELQGIFNHLRQTAITEELLDVVTGFEALAQPRRGRARKGPGHA